ncbi:MAG: DUF2911 domain-containing protein, partial [Cyclobacteriaceae bacterium]|nr:DUF2911 domain-containing protein [Cyclobacteriaceae bacterium]
MKKLVLLCALFISASTFAQEKPASPKETVKGKVGDVNVEVVYSKPSAKGRKVMGDLVPFGEVWRTGANEATTISFDKAVTIEGQKLAAGQYSLFTIPGENEWTIIFNSDPKQWGAYKYKKEKDVLRVTIKPTKTTFTETFTIAV